MNNLNYPSTKPDPDQNRASSFDELFEKRPETTPTIKEKSFGVDMEETCIQEIKWSDKIQEHIEKEKKAYPERQDWLCLADGTINIPKIHESAQWYINRGDGLELFEIQHLCNDADAGMCTMNGDTHQVKITVRQLEILLSAYYRQIV